MKTYFHPGKFISSYNYSIFKSFLQGKHSSFAFYLFGVFETIFSPVNILHKKVLTINHYQKF